MNYEAFKHWAQEAYLIRVKGYGTFNPQGINKINSANFTIGRVSNWKQADFHVDDKILLSDSGFVTITKGSSVWEFTRLFKEGSKEAPDLDRTLFNSSAKIHETGVKAKVFKSLNEVLHESPPLTTPKELIGKVMCNVRGTLNPAIVVEVINEVFPVKEKSKPILAVGDWVEPIYPLELSCGCGRYDGATVVSLNPFKLVSREGDMLWSVSIKAHEFRKVREASEYELTKAKERYPTNETVKKDVVDENRTDPEEG